MAPWKGLELDSSTCKEVVTAGVVAIKGEEGVVQNRRSYAVYPPKVLR